jgi:acetyl esterase
MMSGSCFYSHYQAWGRLLAIQSGCCVFLVDFRNSLMPGVVDSEHSSGEIAEYPGGLNDCVSGLRYLHEHVAEFGVARDKLFLAGESGGANLAISTAMRLNKDGDIHKVGTISVGTRASP